MKKTLLFISLILILALIFGILTACGEKKPNNPEGESGGTTEKADEIISGGEEESNIPAEKFKDDLPETDMEGYVFRMYSRSTENMIGYINVEEIMGEVLNDAMYERNRRIEERFNMLFEEVVADNTDKARTAVKAGDDSYDMITTRCIAAYSYAQEGLLISVNNLKNIDLGKPYWDENLNKVLTVANNRYFAIGASNLTTYDFTDCLLFNKKAFTDLGLEYPYPLVDQGKWTFDKFNELARNGVKDINGDGVFDKDDSYGYIAPAKTVCASFWIGAGNLAVKKDESDIPYFSIPEDERFISTIQKIFEITYDNNVWYKSSSDANVDMTDMKIFENDRALFAYSTFFWVKALRDMETDFGILPYPKLNEEQDRFYCRVSFTDLFTVPVTNKNPDYTSIIIEALACESAKSVIPAYYEITLKTKITRDVDSERMLDIIFNNRVIDLGDTIYNDQIRDGVFAGMYKKGDRDIVSKLEKMQTTIDKAINKTVEAFEALS